MGNREIRSSGLRNAPLHVPTVRSHPHSRSGMTAWQAVIACSHVARADTGNYGQPGSPFLALCGARRSVFPLCHSPFFALGSLRLSAGEASHSRLHPRPLDKALSFSQSFIPLAFAAFSRPFCISLDSPHGNDRTAGRFAKKKLHCSRTRAGIRPIREPSLSTVNLSVRSPRADARCWPAGMLPAPGRLFFRWLAQPRHANE